MHSVKKSLLSLFFLLNLFLIPTSSVHAEDFLFNFDRGLLDGVGGRVKASNNGDLTYYTGSPLPTISSSEHKFGTGSLFYDPAGGNKHSLIYGLVSSKEISLDGEYTIDFWVKPVEPYAINGQYTFFVIANSNHSNLAMMMEFPWSGGGASPDSKGLIGDYAYTNSQPFFTQREENTPTNTTNLYRSNSSPKFHHPFNGPWNGNGASQFRQKANGVPHKDTAGPIVGQWNHIAVQKKLVSNQPWINVAINGQMGKWIPYFAYPTSGIKYSEIVFGEWHNNTPPFYGYIDNFRITEGTARWRDIPDNGTFTLPTSQDYSGVTISDSDKNKEVQLGAEDFVSNTTSLDNNTYPADGVYTSCPTVVGSGRDSVREEYVQKIDGNPKFTSYFDTNHKLICTLYWAGTSTTTGSKVTKRFEYDTNGQIAREIYYGISGESSDITDIIAYYPKPSGGTRYKEIQNRNGTEYYKRYTTDGKLLYEHEYKNGTYIVSRNYTYNGLGKLLSKLEYYNASKYEKVLYTRDGTGTITRVDSYRAYTPEGTDIANYVHTATTYVGTHVASITNTFFNKNTQSPTALRREVTRYVTAGPTLGTVIDQRTFDYNASDPNLNKQRFTTFIGTDGNTLGKTKTDEEWVGTNYATSSFSYDINTGDLTSWKRTDDDGTKITKQTAYNVKNGLIKQEESATYRNNLSLEKIIRKDYNDEGELIEVYVDDFHESKGFSYRYTKSTKDGLPVSLVRLNESNGRVISEEQYYQNGDIWYKTDYTDSGSNYTATGYYVNKANDFILDQTKTLKPNFEFISQGSSDPLARQKLGARIIADFTDSTLRLQAQGSNEKVAILAVLKAILPRYKIALNAVSVSDPLSEQKRFAIYSAYSDKIRFAIYDIEYRKYSGQGKHLDTDIALGTTVTSWYGLDESNNKFWGIYTKPGATDGKINADTAYVDMDIMNPDLVDRTINASTYDTLANAVKKKEKWDSILSNTGALYLNGDFLLYNISGGSGRYVTLNNLTKESPIVNLTLDRFEEDMEVLGVNLSALGETALINKMYEYFYAKNYFGYLYDLSQTAQTIEQTLTRGGGDCEDFAIFMISLLRNEFTRRGITSTTFGMMIGNVDSRSQAFANSQGVGHASIGVKIDSSYYYLDASFLFLGAGADPTRRAPMGLNSLSSSGETFAGPIGSGNGGWYVKVAHFFPTNGAKVDFYNRVGDQFYDTANIANTPISVDTAVTRVSNISTYIEPYNPLVITLASSTVKTIPDFKNKNTSFVVGSVHSFFAGLAQYAPETGGADVWRGVGQTLPNVINSDGTVRLGANISGDCEDLAFAEASLLENVLLRHYLARGELPVNAVAKAKKNVIIIAEKNYKGIEGRQSHLYVGYLIPKTSATPATVRLIDPQDKSIGEPQPLSDFFNDKYLFYADIENVTAITPYDWSMLSLSSAVSASLTPSVSVNPESVAPDAWVDTNNLTLTTAQIETIAAAERAAQPTTSVIGRIGNFLLKVTGIKDLINSTSVGDFLTKLAIKAGLSLAPTPVSVASTGISLINGLSEIISGEPLVVTPGQIGYSLVNDMGQFVNDFGAAIDSITIGAESGGQISFEAASAQSAFSAGSILPVPEGGVDSFAAASSIEAGMVFVRNESVTLSGGPGENRSYDLRGYDASTNTITITTVEVVGGPALSFNFSTPVISRPPPRPVSCPAGIPLCSSVNTGIIPPLNASFSGAMATCYVDGQAPSCNTRQYNTGWICNAPDYVSNGTPATGCTCININATNRGSVGTCEYGATISCSGGTLPSQPTATNPTGGVGNVGVSSFPAPVGTPSGTILWGYDATAIAGNTSCKWSCASVYTYNTDTKQCDSNTRYSCTEIPATDNNTQNCSNTSVRNTVSSNAHSAFVALCTVSPSTDAQKCEYKCASGFIRGTNTCIVDPSSTCPIAGQVYRLDTLGGGSRICCNLTQINVGGTCLNNTTVISDVNLFAHKNTGGTTYESPGHDDKITIRKNQSFKLSWTQTNPLYTDTCTHNVTSPSLAIPEELGKWTSPLLPEDIGVSGDIDGLILSRTGKYVFSISCNNGGVASDSSVEVNVSPSGSFIEF